VADEERFDLDLDAVAPKFKGYVKFKGQRYGVLSIIDVPSGDALEILRIDADVVKQGFTDQIDTMRQMVQKLAPSMTDEVLAGVTTSQMITIASKALGIAEAEEKTGDKADPPAAAASSDSGTGTT
jgi:hypothetical protein